MDKSLSDLQTLIKHSFLLYFPRELLMNFLIRVTVVAGMLPVAKIAIITGHAMQMFNDLHYSNL
jgi:hypothetical protein